MRRKLTFTALTLLLVLALFSPATAGPGPQRAIVVFTEGVGSAPVQARIVQGAGGTVIKPLPIINGLAVTLPGNAAVDALKDRPGVLRVDPDTPVYAVGAPSMARPAAKPGSAPQPDQTLPWGIDRIDADIAWGTATGQGVKLAVIDTGIDVDHKDLVPIAGGANTINPNKSYNDDNGHGTHVAGIAGGRQNSIGVVGVAPAVDLYAVKVLSRSGMGFTSDVIEGIQWAANNDMDVANMSLGSDSDNPSLHDAVKAAVADGVTIVAAAGNSSGGPVIYPAAYPEVIAVSATNINDGLAYFSSVGPEVDLAAPGQDIYSTWNNGYYKTLSGTSMASPHVAGTAALVLQVFGPLSPADVLARLQATAEPLPGLTAAQQGAGLVDAEAALIAP